MFDCAGCVHSILLHTHTHTHIRGEQSISQGRESIDVSQKQPTCVWLQQCCSGGENLTSGRSSIDREPSVNKEAFKSGVKSCRSLEVALLPDWFLIGEKE